MLPTNLAQNFIAYAQMRPDKPAIIFPLRWTSTEIQEEKVFTFGDLLKKVHLFQKGLEREGFKAGDRLVVLLPLSADLFAFVIALFSLGIVTVFIEPGMDLKQMLQAIQESNAKAIFSVRRLLNFRFFLPALWGKKIFCLESSGLFMKTWESLSAASYDFIENRVTVKIIKRSPDDHALITYTTGSTGRPKGADRNHLVLSTQHVLSREHWPEIKNEIDMPVFPMITFQNLSCGITTLLPAYDFANPASLRPQVILSQMRKNAVTRLSAAPYFLKAISDAALLTKQTFIEVRSVIAGGAPVPRSLCKNLLEVFPRSNSFVVYGSTEAEPISFVSMNNVVQSKGEGYLVGRPLPSLQLKVVNLDGIQAENLDLKNRDVMGNHWGEVIIHGSHVVQQYVNNPEATRKTKFRDVQGRLWHRTGDVGRLDSDQNLWLLGRTSDMIDRLPNFLVEQALEDKLAGSRIAVLNGNRHGSVSVFVEGAATFEAQKALDQTLRGFELRLENIHFVEKLPVDRRHYWKIDRCALRSPEFTKNHLK